MYLIIFQVTIYLIRKLLSTVDFQSSFFRFVATLSMLIDTVICQREVDPSLISSKVLHRCNFMQF